MEKPIEKMTKAELIKRLEKEIKFSEDCLDRIEQYRDMENQYILLKYLYTDYVIVKEHEKELINQVDIMNAKVTSLIDLCDRQQRLIDNN